MKKILEAELLSMAHRILRMKNKDVDHLYEDAKKLYEQLLILKFYQDNFEKGLIQDITEQQLHESIEKIAIPLVNEEKNSQERLQMPNDLIEDDYPIVVDSDKEVAFSSVAHSDLVQKIAQEIPEYDQEQISGVDVNHQSEFIEENVQQIQDELTQEVYDFLLQQEGNEELDTATLPIDLEPVVEQYDKVEDKLTQKDFVVSDPQRAIEDQSEAMDLGVQSLIDQEEDFYEQSVKNLEQQIVQFEEQAQDFIEDTQLQDISEVAIEQQVVEEPLFQEMKQIEDDPFSGFNFMDLAFQRVEESQEELSKSALASIEDSPIEEAISEGAAVIEEETFNLEQEKEENPLFNIDSITDAPMHPGKTKSINDIYSSTITVGLNDRIAFEKNLFGGSSEDFNRVLSQLNTVSTYDEAVSLIEHLIKPEYNNWEGKGQYEERFMDIVEKRFI